MGEVVRRILFHKPLPKNTASKIELSRGHISLGFATVDKVTSGIQTQLLVLDDRGNVFRANLPPAELGSGTVGVLLAEGRLHILDTQKQQGGPYHRPTQVVRGCTGSRYLSPERKKPLQLLLTFDSLAARLKCCPDRELRCHKDASLLTDERSGFPRAGHRKHAPSLAAPIQCVCVKAF